LATWLLVWDRSFWLPIIIIVVSHFLIDLMKINLQNMRNQTFWFVLDQCLHLVVIAAIWYIWQDPVLDFNNFPTEPMLIILTAAIFLTSPTSVIIKTSISQWTPETFYTVTSSLPDAGKFIGFLERLLVLTFILAGHWEAVGFLLAAKSVFRFGNLKESHDRKLTEYVLIGTLLSFGIAIGISILTTVLLQLS
ncbi:MAG TPA: DUF3307 domain-containing protein, partial [Chryseosolibacter sp.]|nr:DUF3307 domain-containing protein [Chryseosolibacter sp.]